MPRPVSIRRSLISFRRTTLPFRRYWLSPPRKTRRPMVMTPWSERGKEGSVLSVRVASAIPRGFRESEPLKMTSSMESPRRLLALCSPSTQVMASDRLHLPQPLGPTMAVTPPAKSHLDRVDEGLETGDLEPLELQHRRSNTSFGRGRENTRGPILPQWIGVMGRGGTRCRENQERRPVEGATRPVGGATRHRHPGRRRRLRRPRPRDLRRHERGHQRALRRPARERAAIPHRDHGRHARALRPGDGRAAELVLSVFLGKAPGGSAVACDRPLLGPPPVPTRPRPGGGRPPLGVDVPPCVPPPGEGAGWSRGEDRRG